jgi:hypothetical protein
MFERLHPHYDSEGQAGQDIDVEALAARSNEMANVMLDQSLTKTIFIYIFFTTTKHNHPERLNPHAIFRRREADKNSRIGYINMYVVFIGERYSWYIIQHQTYTTTTLSKYST